jgi:hypothetical protein
LQSATWEAFRHAGSAMRYKGQLGVRVESPDDER